MNCYSHQQRWNQFVDCSPEDEVQPDQNQLTPHRVDQSIRFPLRFDRFQHFQFQLTNPK